MTTSIPAVVKERFLACSAEHAFRTFTMGIASWWPTHTHAIGDEVVDVVFEPRVGGSIHEVGPDGTTAAWGRVTAFEPPHHVAWDWHLTREASTRVDVRFEDVDGGCRMHLVHDRWEQWADTGAHRRDDYDAGWEVVLAPFEAACTQASSSASSSSS